MQNVFKGRSAYWLGRVLLIWSAVATVLILICMVALPIFAGRFIDRAEAVLAELSGHTSRTAQIARDAQAALEQASVALESSASSLNEVRANLEGIQPLLESVQFLLGDEAPDAIVATQQALESAQSGARAMDQVLRVLSSLSFLTGVSYEPEQPLDQALQSVSESLVPMPSALISVSEEIEAFGETLVLLETEELDAIEEIDSMSASLSGISASVSTSVEGLEILASVLDTQAQTLGRKIWIAVIIVELFLLQVALLQIVSAYTGGMLLQKAQATRLI